jgi:hypothetical protein
MRFAGFVFVFVACAEPTTTPHEPPEPDCEPSCFTSCGNGVVDTCLIPQGLGCMPHQEECDGTVGASCTDRNYYGGTGACIGCTFDGSGCDACAVTCVDMPAYLGPRLAASSTNLAIAHEPVQYGPSTLTVLDASLNKVATAQVSYIPFGIAAVPDGWLLVERANAGLLVQHVDMAGAVSPTQPICELCDFAGVAYGPGGRALVAWTKSSGADGVTTLAVILDASGAVVVQPFEVYRPIYAYSTVATDGTSFFVAAGGRLARVAPDANISRTAGFPMDGRSLVSWSGSTGWYVASSDATPSNVTAQAFDATGALVGSPVSITTTTGLQAYGSELVGTSTLPSAPYPERRFAITRVAATGAIVASTEVGVATSPKPVVVPFGSGVAVAWSMENIAHVALVTP